jgi:hypothetical protein
MKQALPTSLSSLSLSLVLSASGDPLKNGDFEYHCTCPWLAGVNEDGFLPGVFVADGNPCSYLRIGTINETDPETRTARAEQIGFTVSAAEDAFIVMEFDFRAFGGFDEDTAGILLSVPGGSVFWTPEYIGSGWQHFQMSAQTDDLDPLVDISFVICDPNNENNVRMDIDNVVVYSSSSNPCPTPEDCDMVESGSFQFCEVDVETSLERQGTGPPDCPCVGDLNNDGEVDVVDWLELLTEWNITTAGCYLADLDCDEYVGTTDMNILLGNWDGCDPLGSPMGGGGGDLEAALVLLGYEDLGAYQEWLAQASEAEALASAYALAALLEK